MIKRNLVLTCLLLVCQMVAAQGIELLGSNGVRVNFAGVLKATPAGLILVIQPDDKPITVPWDKFNADDLKQNHKKIYEAMTAATRQRKPVDLRLGIYEGKQTSDELLESLQASLNDTLSIQLPPLSAFFDDKDIKDGYFRFDHLDDFKYAEKRSERYLKTYTELLQQLLEWEEPTFSKSTHTLFDFDGTRNVVITEARPSRKSISAKPIAFLHFLAEENNRLKNDAVTLLRFNRSALDCIIDCFSQAEEQLKQGRVLAEPTEITNLTHYAESSRKSFESMRESKVTSAELDRELRRILNTFQL